MSLFTSRAPRVLADQAYAPGSAADRLGVPLDDLLDWIDDKKVKISRKERLYDAAAALCGTMLMASSISGSGPDTHDSTISLMTLLPIVARRRDVLFNTSRIKGAATQALKSAPNLISQHRTRCQFSLSGRGRILPPRRMPSWTAARM